MPQRRLVGLIVPEAVDAIPPEAPAMYPDVAFVAKGLGLRSLSAAGYDETIGRIVPAAQQLAGRGVDAIMVVGTSLTFYRGSRFNDELIREMATATGLPCGTMSSAIVAALRDIGARRLAVSTAYTDEVNGLLAVFLRQSGCELLSLKSVGVAERVGEASRVTAEDICDVSIEAFEDAGNADGVLIVCGGLRTLELTARIEDRCGVPVVSSMPAAMWAAARLVGHAGHVGPGYGRLLHRSEGVASSGVGL